MFRINGPVLASLSLGPESADVLRAAAEMAGNHQTGLVVCHILPEVLAIRPLFPHAKLQDALNLAAMEKSVFDRLRELILVSVEERYHLAKIEIEAGTAHSGILHVAERIGAGIIVVGGRSRDPAGSTAVLVLRSSRCPVLVARPVRPGPILAATDFSDPSTPAVKAGCVEADFRGVPLAILHVVDILPVPAMAFYDIFNPVLPSDFSLEIRKHWKEKLDYCVTAHQAKGGGLLREGPAKHAILEAASELSAQMIVVGTHGRSGLSRLALGSTAEAVASGAPCSVLAVRLGR